MIRAIILVILNAAHSGSGLVGALGTYFALLLVTIIIAVPVTAIRLMRPIPQIVAYSSAGSTLAVRYNRDSLDLALSIGTTSIAYSQIKDFFTIGDAVYLRAHRAKPITLPRQLFPDQALAIMGRPFGSHFVSVLSSPGQASKRKRTTVIASVATLVVVTATTMAIVVWQHSDSGEGSSPAPTIRASVPIGHVALGMTAYGDTAYVTSPGGALSVIDTATMTIKSVIPLGADPYGVVFDPETRNVYVAGYGADGTGWVSVIDANVNAVRTTIPLRASSTGRIAIDPDMHSVYVIGHRQNHTDGALDVIDTTSNTVVTEVPLDASADALAVNTATHAVYVGSDGPGMVIVLDGASRRVTTKFPFGTLIRGMAVDPDAHTLYVMGDVDQNLDGPRTLKVLDTLSGAVRATLPLDPVAGGIAVDPATHRVYVFEEQSNEKGISVEAHVRILDANTNSVTAKVTVSSGEKFLGAGPIAVDPATHRAYALDASTISAIGP
ncbi:YncE family protein [Nocardia sp. NBC_01327]|uniref:YncE family protein n=1 Tax=Nocardia sp. NBC_01327 TaxID=2903593 RepID=UPI002E0D1146|nr:YncE family protein [Nocardia sp. NBC_01327]